MQIPNTDPHAQYRAIKFEHKVITVANALIVSVEAIAPADSKSIFVDIDPDTYTLNWRQFDQVFAPNTRVVLPIHLSGHSAEIQPALEFVCVWVTCYRGCLQAHNTTYLWTARMSVSTE
jgi:dTDP-4-amino-4,6-dideoxygalactose transaminase